MYTWHFSYFRAARITWDGGLPEGEIVFEAPDTITNLHIALERYKDQVVQLQSLMWR
jgi:hypothetical protein